MSQQHINIQRTARHRGAQRRVCRWSWVVVVLGLLVASAHAGYGQGHPLEESWRWTHYTTETGLPSNDVHTLVETTSGTLWINTEAGLAWYDSYRWRLLQPVRYDYIVPDFTGHVLGILEQQLYRISREGPEQIPLHYEGAPLAVMSVAPMGADDWVLLNQNGLYRYRGGEVTSMPVPEGFSQWVDIGLWIQRSHSGVLWLLTPRAPYTWEQGTWVRRHTQAAWLVQEDSLGGVMAVQQSTRGAGLWAWQPGETPHRVPETAGTLLGEAMDLNPAGDGLVVLNNGLAMVRADGQWKKLAAPPEPLRSPHFIRYQRNGDLWVGTDEGLSHYRSTTRWAQVPIEGQTDGYVNDVLVTQAGDLWVGMHEHLVRQRPDGTMERWDTILDTMLVSVTALEEDAEGGVWISSGSAFSGAFRWYDGAWTYYGSAEGLAAERVHNIVRDRQGRLWFLGIAAALDAGGGREPGAYVYADGRFTNWSTADGLLSNRVYDFAEAADGALYFATLGGLSRFKEGTWRHWTTAEGLRSNRVFTLALDREGTVWFGHQGYGLGHLDAQGHPRYLDVQDGLISKEVWAIEEGPDGALWITTRDGLARYQEGRFASFGRSSGLAHARLWPVWPLEDRVYVGSMGDGLYSLSLAEAQHPPPLVEVEQLHLNNGNLYIRWQVYPYRGAMQPEQVEVRTRVDGGTWSPWSTVREATLLVETPGRYAFSVQAKGLFGQINEGGTTVSFRVPPPFYRHPLFVLGIGLLLMAVAGLGTAAWRRLRRQNALLKQREARLAEAQHIAQLGSFEVDLVTDRHVLSDELCRMLGVSHTTFPERIEQVVEHVVHPQDRAHVRRVFEQASQTGSFVEHEFRIVRPDGTERTVLARGAYIYGNDGQPQRVSGTLQDVTERKRAEEAIREVQAALLHQREREKERVEEELECARERLVRQARLAAIGQVAATVAHELRNPLGAVRNASYLLRRYTSGKDPRWLEYLGVIEGEVHRANEIITTLLDLSRGKQPNKEEVHLEELVQECFTQVRGDAAVQLVLTATPEPFVVWADAGQLRQVLINVFANAVQAMDDGGTIVVEASREEGVDSILIHDEGPGVPDEVKASIFEPLFTTKTQGTGLGLVVSRQIAEQHGGTLDLIDTERPGATFALRLPALPAGKRLPHRTRMDSQGSAT